MSHFCAWCASLGLVFGVFRVLGIQNRTLEHLRMLDAGCASHRQPPHKFIETSLDAQLVEVPYCCSYVTRHAMMAHV